MSKYVVTGGSGFIGSNLVRDLLSEGDEVVVVDSMHTGSKSNLEGLDVPVFQMRADEFYEKEKPEWADVDGIFHLGKPSASPIYRADRGKVVEAVAGSVAVFEMAREAGAKVVAASTSSVYNGVPPPQAEDAAVAPTDFYTEPRLFEERLAAVYHSYYGVRWAEMRFFSVYGPREEGKKNLANLVTQALWCALSGKTFEIYGDGKQRRDFVYVGDVVRALELAMSSGSNGVYNVGTGTSRSLNEMVDLLEKVTGLELSVRYVPNPVKNYVAVTQASTEKAKKEIGFEAQVALEEGIRRIYDYYSKLMEAGWRPEVRWSIAFEPVSSVDPLARGPSGRRRATYGKAVMGWPWRQLPVSWSLS